MSQTSATDPAPKTPTSGSKTCRASAPWPGCASATRESEARCRRSPASRRERAILRGAGFARADSRVTRRGDWLYNLWRDAAQPARPVAAHHAGRVPQGPAGLGNGDRPRRPGPQPRGKLGLGRRHLPGPDYRRCLVSLSRGGADAKVVREFDTVGQALRRRRLRLPEAKTASTGSTPTRLRGTDFGPGSLTDSGYPRIIKRWQRGQPLADAVTCSKPSAPTSRPLCGRPHARLRAHGLRPHVGFYSTEQHLLLQGSRCHRQAQDAQAHVLARARAARTAQRLGGGRPDLAARQPAGGRRGGLPAGRCATSRRCSRPRHAVAGRLAPRAARHPDVLDNVASRLEEWHPGPDGWQRRDIEGPPPAACRWPRCTTRCADDALAEPTG
jgi:prolyl oligopeptidase